MIMLGLLCGLVAASGAMPTAPPDAPTQLLLEYLPSPVLGVDVPRPRFRCFLCGGGGALVKEYQWHRSCAHTQTQRGAVFSVDKELMFYVTKRNEELSWPEPE